MNIPVFCSVHFILWLSPSSRPFEVRGGRGNNVEALLKAAARKQDTQILDRASLPLSTYLSCSPQSPLPAVEHN